MLSRDLRIVGITHAHANAAWRLLTFEGKQEGRPGLCAAILKDGGPAIATSGGRRIDLRGRFREITAENVGEAARYARARIFVAVEEEELRAIVEKIQAGFRPGEDDFQLLERIFRALKAGAASGRVIFYPEILGTLFDLDARKMRRFFDAVFPAGSSLVFYIMHGQGIEAGFIVVRRGEEIDLVAGHEAIREGVKDFHPWQKGYPNLLEAVKKKYAPPSLGLFADLEAARKILWYPEPGAFLESFIYGKIIIDPMPGWVAAALGIDAVTRVARTSLDLLRQLDTLGIARRFDLSSLGKTLQERLRKEELTLESILGFDPVALVGRIISFLAG